MFEGGFGETQTREGWHFSLEGWSLHLGLHWTLWILACCASVHNHPLWTPSLTHTQTHVHMYTHKHTLRCCIHRHIYHVHTAHSHTLPWRSPWTSTLPRNVLEPEAPPLLVVILLGDASVKHPPAPLVDEVAEGDKGDLVERYLHQKVDVLLCQEKGACCQICGCLLPCPSSSAMMGVRWVERGGVGSLSVGPVTYPLAWSVGSILLAHPDGGPLNPITLSQLLPVCH